MRPTFVKKPVRITQDQAEEIRRKHRERSETVLSLARRFGISEGYCSQVANGRQGCRG